MGFYLLILAITVTSFTALAKPHIGVFAYYLMSIMAPQFLWPWIFAGVPAFKVIAGATILGFFIALIMKKIDLEIYKHRQNFLLLVLFVFMHLSHQFSPFSVFRSHVGPELVLETLNIIVLMYFICLPSLANEKNLKAISCIFIGMVLYYVYWSNNAYFGDQFWLFQQGRLVGPLRSPYRDSNVFAVLFIVGMPFLLFGIFYFKSLFLRGLLGLGLLFSWHSIFLTGSRGALLAAGIATLFAYRGIKSRTFGILLVVAFICAVTYQGGQMLSRTQETVGVAKEQAEEPIDPRIQSWEVGIGLIQKYPILGVGVQRFQEATRAYYPDRNPYVAHNTFLNFSANSGLTCGLIFLYFYFIHYRNFRYAKKNGIEEHEFYNYLNNATMTSLTGYYVGSMFLDLIIFEAYYFVLMLALAKDFLIRRYLQAKENSEAHESTKG